MEVKIKLEGIDELVGKFSPKRIERAVNFAIRRAVRSGKTRASEEIRKGLGFNIMKSDLDRKISIEYRPWEGAIVVAGKPILLSYFKPTEVLGPIKRSIIKKRGKGVLAFELREKPISRGRKKVGVQVEIIRGRRTILSRGRIGSTRLAWTFLAKGVGGTPLVLSRVAKSRKVIARKVYSEHFMFKKVIDKVAERVLEQWRKEWANQVKQLLKGTSYWTEPL